MKNFWGADFGIIAIARNNKDKSITIQISKSREKTTEITQESDFWLNSLEKIIKNETSFGRIGIIFDRKNIEANIFCNSILKKDFIYKQKNIRAEKKPKINVIQTQLIKDFANEGLSDSVEFRRIIRKYSKTIKSLNIDSVLFLEGIFAEKTTRKIIAKTMGTQIKTYFITDFLNLRLEPKDSENVLNSSLKDSNPAKKTFLIRTNDDLAFTKKRAEQILERKLKESDISNL